MFKLFKYLGKYNKIIFAIIFLVFIQSMMELLLPTILAGIIDKGIVKGNFDVILTDAFKMLGVTMIAVVCSFTSVFCISRISVKFGQDIRGKVFVKVQKFSLTEFNKFGVASLITRTTNDITQVQTIIQMLFRIMIFAPLMAIGGFILAFSEDYKLAFVLLVTIPLLVLTIALIGIKAIKLFSGIQKKLDRTNLIFRENLTGIRVIRSFNKQKYEEERFDDANRSLTESTTKAYKLFARLIPGMMIIFYLNSVAIVAFGGIRVGDGTLLIGDLIAFVQYSTQIMFSLIMLSMVFGMLPKALSSARRINEILESESLIKDSDIPEKKQDKNLTLEFKDVNFSYSDSDSNNDFVLENINFEINSGETVVIIGGTGSSKSTLLNLIERFYDVTSGEILLNGVNIKNISQEDLRNNIGYIPQKAVLFSGTVRTNVLYGKENASDDEIINALKISQAYDFVMNLDDGLESKISQGGSNLSGGQKQRLSIARAIVKNAKIYLFDDSFSALDYKTDSKLRAALKENIKDSIILIVGQRISSVMDADKIIVLDNGKIVGMGKHNELLANCEVYLEIAKSQLSEEEL